MLIGGFIRAVWRHKDGTLAVKPARRLSRRDAAAVEAEGRRLLRFLAADTAGREVRILPA